MDNREPEDHDDGDKRVDDDENRDDRRPAKKDERQGEAEDGGTMRTRTRTRQGHHNQAPAPQPCEHLLTGWNVGAKSQQDEDDKEGTTMNNTAPLTTTVSPCSWGGTQVLAAKDEDEDEDDRPTTGQQ